MPTDHTPPTTVPTSQPSVPPPTTAPPNPLAELTAAVDSGVTAGADVTVVVFGTACVVHFQASEANLTEGLIKNDLRLDLVGALKAISQYGLPRGTNEVLLTASADLVDSYGNTSTEEVVRATYGAATIDQINWENLSYFEQRDRILSFADELQISPAFAKGDGS